MYLALEKMIILKFEKKKLLLSLNQISKEKYFKRLKGKKRKSKKNGIN